MGRQCSNRPAVLLFKDSKGGTSVLGGINYIKKYLESHAPVKKQAQYANRARGFAPQQNSGPAISEAAEYSRCHAQRNLATLKSHWSEERPR